jgi:hypothetical protein
LNGKSADSTVVGQFPRQARAIQTGNLGVQWMMGAVGQPSEGEAGMKIEPEKREKRDVATVEKKSVLKQTELLERLAKKARSLLEETQRMIETIQMNQDPILKDAAEFRKRLQAGEEKFLSAEGSAKWRESVRRQQDVIRKQLEAQLKR